MRKQTKLVVVLVTCPTLAAARRLARHIVGRQLAACVNVVARVESVFRWKGKIERCPETLLVIKTTRRCVEPLRRAVVAAHPYDVPEVIALPVVAGHPPYLAWVHSSLSP